MDYQVIDTNQIGHLEKENNKMALLPDGITHLNFKSNLAKTKKVVQLLQKDKLHISKCGYLSRKKLRAWFDRHPQYKRNYINSL